MAGHRDARKRDAIAEFACHPHRQEASAFSSVEFVDALLAAVSLLCLSRVGDFRNLPRVAGVMMCGEFHPAAKRHLSQERMRLDDAVQHCRTCCEVRRLQ